MKELKFDSSLTMEEIEKSFEKIDLFCGLMEGLDEALAYKNGKASPGTRVVVRCYEDDAQYEKSRFSKNG